MNTLISSERYFRPLTHVELDEFADWFDRTVQPFRTALAIARNLFNVFRALAHFDIKAEADGTITLTHQTGSYTQFRADGNVDTFAKRNSYQTSGDDILHNCDPWFDLMTRQERLTWVKSQAKTR